MDKEYRLYIYAFLSRTMADIIDAKYLSDLKKNESLLDLIGEESKAWLLENEDSYLLERLNEDYSSMFVINTQPVESFILDAKNETLVGLQNPVMNFYYREGFDLNMNQSEIMAPDHLSIEFAFMQTLIFRDEQRPQYQFLKEHLFVWVIPYVIGMKSMASTPYYRDLCDFIVEFIVADYEYLDASVEK